MDTLTYNEFSDECLRKTQDAIDIALVNIPVSLLDDEAHAALADAVLDLGMAGRKVAAALARMNIVISSELVS